jgi:hypothetical protein
MERKKISGFWYFWYFFLYLLPLQTSIYIVSRLDIKAIRYSYIRNSSYQEKAYGKFGPLRPLRNAGNFHVSCIFSVKFPVKFLWNSCGSIKLERQNELRSCLVTFQISNFYTLSPSHQIFRRMHGALNVGKRNNYLHSLSVIYEKNLLSLINL